MTALWSMDGDLIHGFEESLESDRELIEALKRHEARVRTEERNRAVNIAALYTVKPGASIYPGLAFDRMNESAKTAAHTTAQQIAWEIKGPEEDEHA